jgi:hypothetical protein
MNRLLRPGVPAALLLATTVLASDHDDTDALKALGRHDARITDFYAFTRGSNLVLAVCTNPTIAPGVQAYKFPADLTLRFAIDTDSEVRFDDPVALAKYGGTVVSPAHVKEDMVFEITFDATGAARVRMDGMHGSGRKDVQLFAGLRDDPFIRGPRTGRNVAAVVLEVAMADVLGSQPTLLLWATSKIPGIQGSMSELGGRALRSQFAENMALNTTKPRDHALEQGVPPDVVIFDTSRPCAFPNGRELADDVVDIVGDPRVLANDAPYPTQNDVPFLDTFPYLAPPQ